MGNSEGGTAVAEPRITNKLLRVDVTCKGVTPLLMNRMSDEQLWAIHYKEKSPKMAPKGSPREVAEPRAYVSLDGELYIPGRCLWACLVAAGQFVRLDGKRQVSSAESTNLTGLMGIGVGPQEPVLLGTKQWEVDMQKGTNPNGGEAVPIVRPRVDVWQFTLPITIFTDQISEDKIRELFDVAGIRRGLLDFRPQRKGIYGQFKVLSWKRVIEGEPETK